MRSPILLVPEGEELQKKPVPCQVRCKTPGIHLDLTNKDYEIENYHLKCKCFNLILTKIMFWSGSVRSPLLGPHGGI